MNQDKIITKNPRIGRPSKTGQQEQFRNHYLENRDKFQLQCELLVIIHKMYFDQSACNPHNQRVSVQTMTNFMNFYHCQDIYRTMLHMNEVYYKNSSLYPSQKLNFTTTIDISYILKAIKDKHGEILNCYALLALVFFFLYNQRVMNQMFYVYYSENIEKFRNGMINGPYGLSLCKEDKTIILLCLQLAVKHQIKIQQVVQSPKLQSIKVRQNSQQEEEEEIQNLSKKRKSQQKILD